MPAGFNGAAGEEVVEHGHADDEARPDLLCDQRDVRVGDARVDLDAAVHRPGMHHELASSQPGGRYPPLRRVLPQRGHVRGARQHPLLLHAEDVDDVGISDAADLRGDLAAHPLDAARNERRRADERRARTDERERLDQRPRHPRVQDVTDDRDVEAVEPPERLAHRVEVEQRLGRVLVLAVAGIHDVGSRCLGDELRRADVRVPDHDHVGVVGGERQGRVLQRLPLVDGRAGGTQRHRVGGESLGGEIEARQRARRRFVEEVDDEAATERRQLLDLTVE